MSEQAELRGSADTGGLVDRLTALGRELGAREGEHSEALERARHCAEGLRQKVAGALEAFHAAAAASGAPHLRIELSDARPDDKHLRSVQFELRRGRTVAIVTVKSRGEATLVGPFQAGKVEGPCKTFPLDDASPLDASAEIDAALADFLDGFLQEAATP